MGLLALASAAAAQAVPSGDSYLCYKAKLAPDEQKFTQVQKTLEDQFGTRVVDVKGFADLCNPTETAVHPAVHAVGYKIAPAKEPPQVKFVKSDHTAIDQFGTHPLTVVKPIEVRAPSAKVPGAGGTGLVNTTGVDHFECYKATPAKGAPKFVPPAPVALTDQFGTQSYTLKKITKLCTPVNKNGEDPTAPQHVGHLVCYQAKLPSGVKFTPQTVSVNNTNFGPAVLVAKAVLEVCVPALKDAVPPTTASSTTSIATSSTTTTTHLPCSGYETCPDGRQCCSDGGPGLCPGPSELCGQRCLETGDRCEVNQDCDLFGHCVRVPVLNICGAGSCLATESCCGGGAACCRNYDQVCISNSCVFNCPQNTIPCGTTEGLCCTAGESCINGTCRVDCGAGGANCDKETETCCSSTCCDTATQMCDPVAGTCQPRCIFGEVYIPSGGFCCEQQFACGNTACCDSFNPACQASSCHCDTATGQCVPNG